MLVATYLRFRKTIPSTVGRPPNDRIDMFYSSAAGKFVARDAQGNAVKFDADAGSNIETSTGGNGVADEGKAALFGDGGTLTVSGLASVFGNDYVAISGVGEITFSKNNDAEQGQVSAATLTAPRQWQLPDASGVAPMVPAYADLTAANAALSSGDYWWDTTLKKLRIATA
jgi:hypothetical protein